MRSPDPLVLLAATALGLIGGCGAPFVHSPSSAGVTVQDPGLVGQWATTGATISRAVIDERPGGRYAVSLTVHHEGELKTALNLELTLTEIGGARYSDLFLSRQERDTLVGKYGFLAIPVHQVMKISRDGDRFLVWSFDGAWLEKHAAEGGFSSDRIVVGGGDVAVLTATTDRVRAFIEQYGDTPEAFGQPMEFHRVGH